MYSCTSEVQGPYLALAFQALEYCPAILDGQLVNYGLPTIIDPSVARQRRTSSDTSQGMDKATSTVELVDSDKPQKTGTYSYLEPTCHSTQAIRKIRTRSRKDVESAELE